MKTILVTGGGGFIGSNLVAALLERGSHHIAVCDHFEPMRGVGKLEAEVRVAFVAGGKPQRIPAALRKAMGG